MRAGLVALFIVLFGGAVFAIAHVYMDGNPALPSASQTASEGTRTQTTAAFQPGASASPPASYESAPQPADAEPYAPGEQSVVETESVPPRPVYVQLEPPPMPVYVVPSPPGDDYAWVPGHWMWNGTGYYWIPGTWIQPPAPSVYWTPGYWSWNAGYFAWHAGYWGPHIGFYGGVHYGGGYDGSGFSGGAWRDNHYQVNRSVTNVTNVSNVTNVTNVTDERVSFNGGPGGTTLRPTEEQEQASHEAHIAPPPEQLQHIRAATSNPSLRHEVNGGKPETAATPRPATATNEEHVRPTEEQHLESVSPGNKEAPQTSSETDRREKGGVPTSQPYIGSRPEPRPEPIPEQPRSESEHASDSEAGRSRPGNDQRAKGPASERPAYQAPANPEADKPQSMLPPTHAPEAAQQPRPELPVVPRNNVGAVKTTPESRPEHGMQPNAASKTEGDKVKEPAERKPSEQRPAEERPKEQQ